MTDQTFDDLAFGIGPKLAAEIAEAWAWLVPPGWEPVLCAMIGGVFFQNETGVHWLDCLTGQVERVADDVAAFEARLAGDAEALEVGVGAGMDVAAEHAGADEGDIEGGLHEIVLWD